MEIETLNWLRSPAGVAVLAELAQREANEADALRELERLRKLVVPDQARAALELHLLRRRARAKFPDAERMFFSREALEQASTAPVAFHRAARFAGAYGGPTFEHVADLCCSIGGDALAMAAVGLRVTAVDRDPLRLAMAAANAEALGLASKLTLLQRDLVAEPLPAADALFCDPGRRAGGRRRFDVEAYEPPLSLVLGWRAQTPALGVKLAPGVDLASVPNDIEVEFVSLDGELKEATLWCGPLAQAHRRATVLRSSPDKPVQRHELVGTAVAPPSTLSSRPLAFLIEPDPAVIRAGLVRDLAAQLGAAQLDPQIAYLTGEQYVETPFARAWPVLEWLPFSLKGLRARLRARGAGQVTVKKRGSPLDTDALARQLSGSGAHALVVVLTQLDGKPVALICGTVVKENI